MCILLDIIIKVYIRTFIIFQHKQKEVLVDKDSGPVKENVSFVFKYFKRNHNLKIYSTYLYTMVR